MLPNKHRGPAGCALAPNHPPGSESTPMRAPQPARQLPAAGSLAGAQERGLRQVDGASQRGRLVHRLLVLGLRHAVRHHARARLQVHHPLAPRLVCGGGDGAVVLVCGVVAVGGDDHSAQTQRHVHGAREGHVADAAAVRATLGRLQLVNDLHGAHLGRARHRARGQRGAQRVPRVQLRQQVARDGGGDVHDVAVPLHLHQLAHLDAAADRHLAHVVATQVHKHDVLRALLAVGQQLALQRRVLLRAGPAPARARQRAVGHHALAVHAAQDLGRRGHDDGAARLHVHHVGRGVDHAQRAVHLERRGKRAPLKALAQHQLEDVAGQDVLLGGAHRAQELLPGHVGLARGGGALAQREANLAALQRRRRRVEQRRQVLQARRAAVVRLAQRGVAAQLLGAHVHPGDGVHNLGGLVKHHHVVVQREVHVGQCTVVHGR
mmetsp:Transcript_29354/g.74802  ORF Transcript_29354/g.74802 Transcript_29354/m.74802 type:complete len:435 (-) Transcript_29354:763-2067(-)